MNKNHCIQPNLSKQHKNLVAPKPNNKNCNRAPASNKKSIINKLAIKIVAFILTLFVYAFILYYYTSKCILLYHILYSFYKNENTKMLNYITLCVLYLPAAYYAIKMIDLICYKINT